MPIRIRGRAGLAILALGTAAIAACSGSSSAWTPAVALPGAAGATLNGITTGTTSSSPFVAVGTVPATGRGRARGRVDLARRDDLEPSARHRRLRPGADARRRRGSPGVHGRRRPLLDRRVRQQRHLDLLRRDDVDADRWDPDGRRRQRRQPNGDRRRARLDRRRHDLRLGGCEPAGDLDVERRVGLDARDATRRGRSGVRHAPGGWRRHGAGDARRPDRGGWLARDERRPSGRGVDIVGRNELDSRGRGPVVCRGIDDGRRRGGARASSPSGRTATVPRSGRRPTARPGKPTPPARGLRAPR